MSCITEDFSVVGDKNDTLKKSVSHVAENMNVDVHILASFFHNPKFITFVRSEGITEENLVDVNQNTLRSLIKRYYIISEPRISNTTDKSNADMLKGFTTAKAKSLAVNYTADIYNRVDVANKERIKTERISDSEIESEVIDQIERQFFNYYAIPFYNSYIEHGGKDVNDIESLIKEQEELDKWLDDNQDATDEVYFPKLDQYEDVHRKLRTNLVNFLIENGDVRHKNYANLLMQVLTNKEEWFNEVKGLQKLKYTKHTGIISNEVIDDYFAESDDSENNEESDGLNEEAQRYKDVIDKYKSYMQIVGSNVRSYLSSLRNMSKIWDGTGAIEYDTNNELGVSTGMNPGYLINVLTTRADFASGIEGFISSIEKLISGKQSLYGLSAMVVKMKVEREFANMIFHELANPVVIKTMISLEENNTDFRRSNNNADPALKLLFTMNNQIKSTIFEVYDEGTVGILNYTKTQLNSKDDVTGATRVVKRVLSKYFPGIDLTTIDAYINYDTTDVKSRLNKLLDLSVDLVNAASDIITQRNSKVKYANLNFNKTLSVIRNIVDEILP